MKALLVSTLMLGGCAGFGPVSDAGPYPTDYKALAARYVNATFKDPDSIKNAAIAKPMPYKNALGVGYVLCISANSKNSFGGYTGNRLTTAWLDSNRRIRDFNAPSLCDTAVFEPWPEMNGKG